MCERECVLRFVSSQNSSQKIDCNISNLPSSLFSSHSFFPFICKFLANFLQISCKSFFVLDFPVSSVLVCGCDFSLSTSHFRVSRKVRISGHSCFWTFVFLEKTKEKEKSHARGPRFMFTSPISALSLSATICPMYYECVGSAWQEERYGDVNMKRYEGAT